MNVISSSSSSKVKGALTIFDSSAYSDDSMSNCGIKLGCDGGGGGGGDDDGDGDNDIEKDQKYTHDTVVGLS